MSAEYIAGRRVVGDVDKGLTRIEADRVASDLRIQRAAVPRTGKYLKGDIGLYSAKPGEDKVLRSIFTDEKLEPESASRVFRHELGHAVDDLAGEIPSDGLHKELRTIYEHLNTGMAYKPGKGMTPKGRGYNDQEADYELMAEAIRAYMADPNYIKTVAPNTAARIHEYVNTHPALKDVIQFNSAAPAGIGLFMNQGKGDGSSH